MSKSYVPHIQMLRWNAYLRAMSQNILVELCGMDPFYHNVHTGAFGSVEGNEAVEMICDDMDFNIQLHILLEELEQLLLETQTLSNSTIALDFNQEHVNGNSTHMEKKLNIRRTYIKRTLGNSGQNRSRQHFKTRTYLLDRSPKSYKFNDDGLTVKNRCQPLNSSRNPEKYKLTQNNWKKLLNSEHKHNYILCLFFECHTLHVDIAVLDRQIYEMIHLEIGYVTFCSPLAKGLNDRAIESSDKTIRSHKRETDCCADDRRSESSNHRETLRIKQELRKSLESDPCTEKPSATEHFEKRDCCWSKLFSVLLLMSVICRQVSAAPLTSNKEVLQSKQLLRTTYCNQETLYSLNANCQKDESSFNTLIDSCKFKELCDKDEKPVCVNTKNGFVFVCMAKSLVCAKGYKITAWVEANEPNIVYVQKEKCPNGTFQPYESDCIHACLEKHRDLKHVNEKYVVYSEGDNVSPIEVYCNYKKGFFNGEGEFLLDYDRDEIYKPYFCDHINDTQPCKGGQYPLSNGTCVGHCQVGFERNAHDFFCKLIGVTSTDMNAIPTSPSVTRTSYSIDTSSSHEEATTENLDETQDGNENVIKKVSVFPWWGYLLIVVGFTSGAAAVLSLLVVRRCRKRNSNTNKDLGYKMTPKEDSDEISSSTSNSFQDSDQSQIVNVDDVGEQNGVEIASDTAFLQNTTASQVQNSRSSMVPRRVENNHSTKIGNQTIVFKNATNVTIHSNQSGLSASFVESDGDASLQSEKRMVTFENNLEWQENGSWKEDGEEESYRPLTDNTEA